MGHQEHVASTIVLIVESKIVDLTEIGPSTDDIRAVLKEVSTERLDKGGDIFGTVTSCDLRVKRRWNRLPGSLLQNRDHLGRLYTTH